MGVKVNATIRIESERADEIIVRLMQLHEQGAHMAGELARLTQEVAETKTVMQGAAVLLGTLAQKIRDLSTDPAALTALADELDAEQGALGSAIAANTPTE